MISAVSTLCFLLIVGTQDPEKAAAAKDEGWRDLDIVLQIVNEDMLTSRTLIREMARWNRTRPITNASERAEAEQMIRRESIKESLRVQAGEDLGVDPAQLDRQVKDWLRRMQERLQGSAGMSNYLADRDRTLYEEQEYTRNALHALLWDNHITGQGSTGEGARPTRDTYVRPGYLSYTYRQCLEHPELLEVVGGSEPTVVLQNLLIDPEAAGGEEAGQALAEDLRARIVAGEDMGDLVDNYDASKANKQTRGLTEPLLESRLKEVDPAVGAFVAESQPGDVSNLIRLKAKDGKEAWRIVRLVERRAAVVPPLDSIYVQTKLTKRISEDLAEWRRGQGLAKLVRAAYIWPPELKPR